MAGSWAFTGTHRPGISILLLLLGTAYATGWWRLWRRARRLVPWWRPALTLAGLGSLALALLSPLDALAHRLFVAHMVQHVLLVAVAAPALLLADPLAALLWALPAGARVRAGRLLVRGAPLRRIWWAVTRAPVAWLGYALVLWLWHLPPAYDAALEDRLLHDLEHLAFFASAVLFWWPVINPAPHLGRALHPGSRVVYLVLGALQSAALGLLLAASPIVLYSSYAAPPEPGTLNPLDDQALGGVVMWGFSGAVDMLAVLLLLYKFFTMDDHEHLAKTERRGRRRDVAPSP
ncbi:MAG TPA: cytochrome c oxidase assembly protein [Methylomirabilota bacterium]|jgi:cytochrome c oxidase assembly factor CtaG|nr:cytochrome c oxidase assembly protein [Methylomirabilota bacterium]